MNTSSRVASRSLLDDLRMEFKVLALVGSHGTPSGMWFVDLTPVDVEIIRDLIKRARCRATGTERRGIVTV